MENFTSNYLSLLKSSGKISEIVQEGVPIPTIQINENPKPFRYSHPKLLFQKYAKEKEMVTPDIKIISSSLTTLRSLGIEIISLPVVKKWLPKQSTQYKLKKSSLISEGDKVLKDSIPSEHIIEYDRANKMARIMGKNCKNNITGVYGMTEWIYV